MSSWLAPPDRRETILIFLCLSAFFFAYNIDSSIELIPLESKGFVLNHLGFGRPSVIGKDGLRPAGWRDKLETRIFGGWAWDAGHTAGNGEERSQRRGADRHGAMWLGRKEIGDVAGRVFGESSVDEALTWWREDIPQTEVVKHVPGYTILDNVFIFNGTVYLVTDQANTFPPLASIISSTGAGFGEWHVLNKSQAIGMLGSYGGVIRGVSWMHADNNLPHNATLFSMWRLYSTLDPEIDEFGQTTLEPPHRLIYPHRTFFTDPNPPILDHWIRRRRTDTGFHPYLAKTAFPQLTVMYSQDWQDYQKMQVPFFFERLLVADRKAARRSLELGQPSFSPPFEMDASIHWWEPIRKTLAESLLTDEDEKSNKVITYLHRQNENNGPKLSEEDHNNLIHALKKIKNAEINIISTSTEETDWSTRMKAISRSTIVVGVYGNHLLDSVFMKITPHTTLMEFYPEDTFMGDQVLAVHSLGMQYRAWWGDKYVTPNNLPLVSDSKTNIVHVGAEAVTREINSILAT